jgi:hypothetical protein
MFVFTHEEPSLEALQERNNLHKRKQKKANWIGHMLRRKYLLKLIMEGEIERKSIWRERRRQLLDDLKENRGYRNLKEEALYSTL